MFLLRSANGFSILIWDATLNGTCQVLEKIVTRFLVLRIVYMKIGLMYDTTCAVGFS